MKRTLSMVGLLLALASVTFAAVPPRSQRVEALQRARVALFESNDLDGARAAARSVLQRDPANAEALFLEMESAALQADTTAELDAAMRLVEFQSADRRAPIAASRLLDLAANSAAFRPLLPRLRRLIAAGNPQSSYLQAALIAAAADGTPGISLLGTARDAGLLTDWRLAGPFGRLANLDFDRTWAPEREGLSLPVVDGRAVEAVRFQDGSFATPDYFSRLGVYYAQAMAQVQFSGAFYLRVETAGTVEVFVDGVSVLRKDDRFRATPEIAWRQLRLSAGTHRVMVKYLASAAPFRVALLPGSRVSHARVQRDIPYAPEASYVAASLKFWDGDYAGALALVENSGNALSDYLAARAWSHVAGDSAEEADFLRKTISKAPSAMAAETDLAQRGFESERVHEALSAVMGVLKTRPDYAPAQALMAQLAMKMDWPFEARQALDAGLQLHPSCELLKEADGFFAAHGQYERASQVEEQLRGCGAGSQAYIEALARSGRHSEAAQAAAEQSAGQPLDRASRESLVRELLLAGNKAAAAQAAQQLSTIAPNSRRYAEASADPAVLLDNAAAPEIADPNPFYAPWRRDGIAIVEQTRQRQFSGGPAVRLLDDTVAAQRADGSISLYVHKLTRVLNRDGIERYGEAEVPAGAELLELRTIKPDGTVAEPEVTANKATISMPALAAGDAIDEEYVVNYPGGLDTHPDAFAHTFGSFRAPILYSRFVVVSNAAMQVESLGAAPTVRQEDSNGRRILSWEQNDIPQSVEEAGLPETGALPAVRVRPELERGWNEVRDRVRDTMVDALRIGTRLQTTADTLTQGLNSDDAKARALYRWVMTNIQNGEAFSPLDPPAAEDTVGSRSGSRTVALLALARAAHLQADLLLARNPSTPHPRIPALDAYTRPVVLFHFADRDVAVDAETEGLAFGALSPGVERDDALLAPLLSAEPSPVDTAELRQPPIVAVPEGLSSEQSIATADVQFSSDGNLAADVRIVLGSWRASQMRSILSGIEPGGRTAFFEQLAGRIFSGVTESSGEVRYERDGDHPLEILLHCRATHAINLTTVNGQQIAELDQLVPTLGLKKMYAAGDRKFPLFVDTPLVEVSTFRVHLPEGVQILQLASDARLRSKFGEYSLTFRRDAASVVEVRREFRIPVQVVPINRIASFRRFAQQIDDAERQHSTLTTDTTAASASASLPVAPAPPQN